MLIRIYPENPNPREMAKALKMLRDGELIIYPTDTVYAIGCDALNVRAVEKICALKGVNPQKSNLSIICYDLSNISEYAQVSNAAFKLLKKNLPGPFTFILPTSSRLPKIYKNKKEVGIRVPDNSIARGLVDGLGNPILTMSVHDEDEIIEYSTDPELIHEKYEGRVALVIDGGSLLEKPASSPCVSFFNLFFLQLQPYHVVVRDMGQDFRFHFRAYLVFTTETEESRSRFRPYRTVQQEGDFHFIGCLYRTCGKRPRVVADELLSVGRV